MSQGYEALRTGVAWLDLRARGRILARGRDRARFLHNVTSNEVKKMTPGSVAYAFLLTPQGRIQADLWLVCYEDHFLIDTLPELREKVRTHILKYKVADQVELEDVTETAAAIGVEGPAAAGLGPGGYPITETGQPGYRIYCAASEMGAVVASLGVPQASDEDARVVRIENGKPQFGEDIRETSLVQETQQMHAVSFNKGCYLGQEIVERVRAMGHVNKKLVRLEIDTTEPIPAGTKLTADGAEVGEVTSSVVSPRSGKVAAMAYVRTLKSDTGTVLDADGARAVISQGL